MSTNHLYTSAPNNSYTSGFRLLRCIDPGLLLVILVPLILLLSNHEWLFPYGNATDNWLNYAFFYGYGHDYGLFHSYKASRLDWIFKGFLLHKFFAPLTAYYIMCFSTFYLCTISFYYIAKNFFIKQIAIIVALAFSTYSQFISIISFEWDYTTHDAIANLNLALLLLILAAKKNSYRSLLFLSGIFCTCSFQNTYTIMSSPVLVLFYILLNKHYKNHSLLKSAAYFLCGVIATTLFFCSINYFVFDGPFIYFASTILIPINSYRYQPGYWVTTRYSITQVKSAALPIGVFLLSLVSLILFKTKRFGRKINLEIKLITYAAIIIFSLLLIGQCLGHPLLSLSHMTIATCTFFILGIGAFLSIFYQQQQNPLTLWLFVLICFVLFCGTLVLGNHLSTLPRKFTSILAIASVVVWLWKTANMRTIFLVRIAIIALLLALCLIYGNHFDSIWRIPYFNLIIFTEVMYFSLLTVIFLYTIKKIRYFPLALILIFFTLTNFHSSSIPLSLYQYDFPSTFLHDQYITIQATFNYLEKDNRNLNLFLWYKNEKSSYHTKNYSTANIARAYWGSTSISLMGGYDAIHGSLYYQIKRRVPNKLYPTFYLTLDTLKQQCPSVYQLAPAWIGKSGKIQPQQRVLGGRGYTEEFSTLPGEKFWLIMMPKNFTLAILTQDNKAYQEAISALNANGYGFNELSHYSASKPAVTIMTHIGTVKPLYNTPEQQCIDKLVIANSRNTLHAH